ncbi:MAG: acetoacetate--CoA ligase, partial [Gemmataceae bacterium]
QVKPVPIHSISGGTDIISCFLLGVPGQPVVRGELQGAGLGMDVQIVDDSGTPVRGIPGELTCATPFPSMPLGFWNDADHAKYLASYFPHGATRWFHGDWATQTSTGFIIEGRSDNTLNPGGVRIGTAELYQQVEAFPEVVEALAVPLRQNGDEEVVLFLRLHDPAAFTSELVAALRQRLRTRCSPRHVPAHIAPAPDFPRTISGKLSEVAVRNVLNGQPVRNLSALANPESLEHFRKWAANRSI